MLPFAVGLVLAYLFMPVISWLEEKLPRPGKWRGLKRVSSVLLIFLLLIGLMGIFTYFIVAAVIDASMILLENAPYFIGKSLLQIQEWFEGVRQFFPPEIRQEVDKALVEAGIALGHSIRDAFVGGIVAVPRNFGVILGFAALPFFLFYIMKDSERLQRSFYSSMTPAVARHARNIIAIVEQVLGRYIRAQLMLGLIVAYFCFLGLLILGIQFAPVLAILAGITELIPTLGPWIGGAVAVIVTLAVAPEKAIWVIALFSAVQMVENYFLVPRIQGAYMRIHPAIMIVLLVVGAYVAGFWGLILAAPLTATAVEIYKYIWRQYRSEEAEAPAE